VGATSQAALQKEGKKRSGRKKESRTIGPLVTFDEMAEFKK
jgi:hypothetical protein